MTCVFDTSCAVAERLISVDVLHVVRLYDKIERRVPITLRLGVAVRGDKKEYAPCPLESYLLCRYITVG